MQLEPQLCAALRKFFNFKGHSLHFPLLGEGEAPPTAAEWLPDEGKLLLPLCRFACEPPSNSTSAVQADFLGLFVARGVDESVGQMLPWLPAAASLCLDNLALQQRVLRDESSGLFSREHTVQQLIAELKKLREAFGQSIMPSYTRKPDLHASGSGADVLPGTLPAHGDGNAPVNAGGRGSGRFGLLVLRLNGLAAVAREHGYARADALLALLARELEARKPGLALAGRSSDTEFCLLLPGFGAQACQELAEELCAALGKVRLNNEVSGHQAAVGVSAGYIDCPRDLDGLDRHKPAEQARLLLRRARLAAATAWEGRRLLAQTWNSGQSGQFWQSGHTGQAWQAGQSARFEPRQTSFDLAARLHAKPAVLSYRGILAEGGRVVQVNPLARLQVNLGKNVGARAGQRFSIYGYVVAANKVAAAPAPADSSGSVAGLASGLVPEGTSDIADGFAFEQDKTPELVRRYKGELRLLDVRAAEATAELVYCDDPYFQPAPGDQLLLIERENVPEQTFDPATGFLSHSGFLPAWCREREHLENSALLLTRFSLAGRNFDLPGLSNPESYQEAGGEFDYNILNWEARWERLMAACADLFRQSFGSECLYGRYALNSFAVFIPGTTSKDLDAKNCDAKLRELRGKAEELCRHLQTGLKLSGEAAPVELACAIGLAPHPFLDFHKADGPDNAHKALEYALLLPFPQVGTLDTLALNISADRLYSQGDHLGAISEYKRALLCDENNILAWNSLGVTLAGLGRNAEARRHLEEALRRSPDDSATLYNLGQLCQSAGELDEAERLYSRCRELEAQAIYPLYRLGQLAEQRGDNRRAREFYDLATALPGGQSLTRRSLARLAIREERLEDAREELHEALLVNPNDAVAMQLLAGLYLDAGENPLVAASLARQAAALRPDMKAAWLELARALELAGRGEEAREALIRSGEL